LRKRNQGVYCLEKFGKPGIFREFVYIYKKSGISQGNLLESRENFLKV
jgi:hypothetical protein